MSRKIARSLAYETADGVSCQSRRGASVEQRTAFSRRSPSAGRSADPLAPKIGHCDLRLKEIYTIGSEKQKFRVQVLGFYYLEA